MNQICHIEFDCTDFDRTQRFLEGLFGWTFRSYEGMDMRVFGQGEQHIGGLMLKEQVVSGPSPSIWIQVADLDRVLALAPQLGGRVLSGRQPVPGVGFSAQIADPDGNPIGVVEYV